MRTKWALFLLVMVTLVAMAYVPALTDFNSNQFQSTGHNLSIKTGALTTNDQHYVVGAGSQSTFFSSGVEGIHFDNTGLWWLGNTAGNARIIQWNSPLLSLSATTQINPDGITMAMFTNNGVFVYSNLTVRGGMILMTNANSGAFLFPTGTNFTFGIYGTNSAGVLATNFWISNPGNIGGGFNFESDNTNKVATITGAQDGTWTLGTNGQWVLTPTGGFSWKNQAVGDISGGTNFNYLMGTNNGGGNALSSGTTTTSDTCIITNIAADTTLKAMTFWTGGLSVIPVYVTASGANRQLIFPAGFVGAGSLYNVALTSTGTTITNAESKWFEVRCLYGVKTNVFESASK